MFKAFAATLTMLSVGLVTNIQPAQAYYLNETNCKGVILQYGGYDFYNLLMKPDLYSGQKPGAKVYAGEVYDVAATKGKWVGLVVRGQNTIGYIPKALVKKACGQHIPQQTYNAP